MTTDAVATPGTLPSPQLQSLLGVVSEREWVIHRVARTERVPIRFYLAAGVVETDADRHEAILVQGNRFTHDVMPAKGYDVISWEYPGGRDWFI